MERPLTFTVQQQSSSSGVTVTMSVRRIRRFGGGDRHRRELLSGAGKSFAMRVLGQSLGVAFVMAVTRLFGLSAMGTYAFCLSVLTMASIAGRLGYDTLMVRVIPEYKATGTASALAGLYIQGLSQILSVSVLLSGGVALAATTGLLDGGFDLQVMVPLALPFFVLIHFNAACLQGLKRIVQSSFLIFVAPFMLALGLLPVLDGLGYGHNIPLASLALSYVAIALLSQVLLLRALPVFAGFSDRVSSAWSLTRQALPMMLSSSLLFLAGTLDVFMLGIMATKDDAGLYGVAFKLSSLISFTLYSINAIAAPKMAELYYAGEIARFRALVKSTTGLVVLGALPIALVLLVFPSRLLGLFGAEFELARVCLLLLCIGQCINALCGPVGLIMNMTGHQKAMQNLLVLATLVNILLNIILIPRLGIEGAALGSVVAFSIWNIAGVVYVKRQFGVFTLFLPSRTTLDAI